jgi:hypothetical protein
MAAPLLICTKEEQRTMVNFLWEEGVKGVEIQRHFFLLSMGIMCYLNGECMSGLKCLRMAG